MKVLRSNGRGLAAHLGSYIIIISMLAGLNLMTSSGAWWFLYPALIWGAALAVHVFYMLPLDRLGRAWSRFLRHFGLYAIIIAALTALNMVTFAGVWWFLYPALIWGAALALHFLFGIVLVPEKTTGRSFASEQRQAKVSSAKRRIKISLSNKSLQFHFNRILAYQAQLDRLSQSAPGEHSRMRLENLSAQIDRWIEDIGDLARRIDQFQRSDLIRRELKALPKSIRKLESRMVRETDQTNRLEMKRTLDNLKKQLACLEQSQQTIRRAELQIERMLSSMGAVYSQILLANQSADHVTDYSRLSEEVEEQVRVLQDHLEALEEVKFSRV